ncbi:MAG: uroporphyrinogen decarboxylase family protein [Candidatus Aminicenantes bacterium]
MKERMTRYERLEAAWNLEKADRVPVAPINCYIIPYLGGISIKEMFFEPQKLIQATVKCLDIIGDNIDPNITTLDHLSLLGKSGWDQVTLDWRIRDEFPPQGNIPSFFEKPVIEDYDDVMERGFSTILFNKKLKEVFLRSLDDFLYYEFEYPKIYAQAWREFVEKHEIPLLMGGRACHPLDLLQYYRGISLLTEDIFERPEKVKQMSEFLLQYEVNRAMKQAMTMGAGEVPGAEVIFFVNGGPPGMSPRIFDEFFWPFAKKAVDCWVNRGFRVYCHWDNDLTPFLNTIKNITTGLPRGKVLIDFEKTDMKKAKQVLGDKVCIYGNVPSSLLVYGTPEEVDAFCKKLIQDCAEGGGYILGTECETPWDAKRENVRAVIEAASKYGQY